jgi:hypothetical protein
MSGKEGGPSDGKDAMIKDLEAKVRAAEGAAAANMSGQMRQKVERKARESLAQRVFGKFGRR